MWETLRCYGSKSLGFFDYGTDVREIGFVSEGWETIWSDYAVEFFLG